MNEDLKLIKKKYGEAMCHLCRELFPTLLERKGLLPKLLLEHFDASHILCEDIVKNDLIINFKEYIYSLEEVKNDKKKENIKTPEELFEEAGYNLYECKTEEDIQIFKKYYAPNEELCTFNGGRLNRCRVFFAVKKNVDEIKRENFSDPERQDLYGTSVISIQFDKDETNRLSIKNRYNHTVQNPDSTFSNNLDNIVEGLTDSFEKHYGIIQKYKNNSFEIPNYVMANDGKFYKYNYEIDNTYYCSNNIIINSHGIHRYDKEKYIILDYFILDLVNKKIEIGSSSLSDSFIDCIGTIQKIEIKNQNDVKVIIITNIEGNTSIITLNKENQMIGFSSDISKEIKDDFLFYNETLQKIKLPNVEKIGNSFLRYNNTLIGINLPNVLRIGDCFLRGNLKIKTINFPNVVKIGSAFLQDNKILLEISLPKVEEIQNEFLCYNQNLTTINFPNLKIVGVYFLNNNHSLQHLNLPRIKIIGDYFLSKSYKLKTINLPNVEEIGHYFLLFNQTLQRIELPKVKKIGNSFLDENYALVNLDLPNVLYIGSNFLANNQQLLEINLPKIERIGSYFLQYNNTLTMINFPNLQTVGPYFLPLNKTIQQFYTPNLQQSFYQRILPCHPKRSLIIQMLEQQRNNDKEKQLIKKR